LSDWYERIAFSTETNAMSRLSDHVLTGRAIDLDLEPARPFAELIESGSVADKQSILGLIARKFHPDYLPALQRALVSDEPVIRVQAAAVAAKIRADMPALVKVMLVEAADANADLDRVAQIIGEARACLLSGLLEAKDADQVSRVVDDLLAQSLAQIERGQGSGRPVSAAAPVTHLYETHLLAQARFADFRQFRRKQAWAQRGPWRWRRLMHTRKPHQNGSQPQGVA
jgi:hypothetical protein